ncbi:MAG: hypothetical protein JKY89_10660 [Immundisolibacteraceae bacterium]|nr:hypothetical protein [Immundisolibacteraceae bacterium]
MSCVVGTLIVNTAVAEKAVTVYRWQHPDGSVEFSDESRLGAEPVVVEEPMILPSVRAVKNTTWGASVGKFSYASLLIKSPLAESSFRNEAALSILVTGEVEPGLRRGDQLVLLVDGAVHTEPGRLTTFNLPVLERGAHTLQLELRSADGDRIKQSESITIYVQRNIARPKAGG